MASTVKKLLDIQEQGDNFLSATARLRAVVSGIMSAKKEACVDGGVDADDVRRLYYTHVTTTYKPFMAVLSQYIRTNIPTSSVGGGTVVEVAFDSGNSNFVGDMVVLITIPQIDLSMLQTVLGMPIVPVPGYGLVRYCQYPGVRLFEKVEFLINQKVVESYTADNVLDYRFSECDVAKQGAFDRSVGQQRTYAARYAYNFDQSGKPIAGGNQLWSGFANGAQTAQNVQPSLTLAIPILFNWCRDGEIPMSNDYLNVKQRSLRITLAPMSQIVSHYVDMPVATVATSFQFSNISVLTRSIFMDQLTADLFKRPQKMLVRTYRTYNYTYNSAGNQVLPLDSIGYPVECMYLKFTPNANFTEATIVSGGNLSSYDYWFVPAQLTKSVMAVPFLSPVAGSGALIQNGVSYEFYAMADVAQSVSMSILDVDLYGGAVVPAFMSGYVPWGERSILQASPFPGAYVFNFSQAYRGDLTHTAAGYLDFTLLQNKILSFVLSDVVGPNNPVTMTLSLRFINFFEPSPGGVIQYTYPIV